MSLKSQTVRAAESIPFNIVEGCGAESQREFARFLAMSIKSARELEEQLELAKDYHVLSADAWLHLTADTVRIRKMTFALRTRVLDAVNAPDNASERQTKNPSPPTPDP